MNKQQRLINNVVSTNCDYPDEGDSCFKESNINALVDYDDCLTAESIHALMRICYGKETSITTMEDYKTYQQMKEL